MPARAYMELLPCDDRYSKSHQRHKRRIPQCVRFTSYSSLFRLRCWPPQVKEIRPLRNFSWSNYVEANIWTISIFNVVTYLRCISLLRILFFTEKLPRRAKFCSLCGKKILTLSSHCTKMQSLLSMNPNIQLCLVQLSWNSFTRPKILNSYPLSR